MFMTEHNMLMRPIPIALEVLMILWTKGQERLPNWVWSRPVFDGLGAHRAAANQEHQQQRKLPAAAAQNRHVAIMASGEPARTQKMGFPQFQRGA